MTKRSLLTCIIVEDEPLAAELLEDYISTVPFLRLVGTCPDAVYALDILHEQHVDVIFLDIHLPKIKGLALAKTLREQIQIIFTTAYQEYALEGFEVNAVDYLLKPIEFSRFLKAVNKLDHKKKFAPVPIQSGKDKKPFHFFNVNKKMIKVFLDEVRYIESLKDYIRIYTENESLVTQGQISDMERNLDHLNFLRVHRSFLINVDHVSAYTMSEIELGEYNIPIGRTYKQAVSKVLDRLWQ